MPSWKFITNGSTKDFLSDYGFKVGQAFGFGMAPVSNIAIESGLTDGGIYKSTRVEPQTLNLTGTIAASDTISLHTRRRQLMSDLDSGCSVEFRYHSDSGSIFQASVFYEAGLELGAVERNHEQSIALRFLTYDPVWERTATITASIPPRETTTYSSGLQRKKYDSWHTVGNPSGGGITVIDVIGDSADLFFLSSGFGVRRYESGIFWPVGSNLNSTVWTIGKSPDETIYIGGQFDDLSGGGGTNISAIAQHNGSDWVEIDGGLTGGLLPICRSLTFDNAGVLYAVGDSFTSAGSIAVSQAAKLDPNVGEWEDPFSGRVVPQTILGYNVVAVGPDNSKYFGGRSHNIDGSLYTGLIKLDNEGNIIKAGSLTRTGGTAQIRDIAIDKKGSVYITGIFETVEGIPACSLAKLEEGQWYNIGDLPDATFGYKLSVSEDNTIVVGGVFPKINDIESKNVGMYNGVSWNYLAASYDGIIFNTCKYLSDDTLILSGGATPDAIASSAIVTNNGIMNTYPIFTACGSERLIQIANFTTEKFIDFNLELLDGEVVTMDLTPGKKTVESTVRGNILHTVLEGSDFINFNLVPGDNLMGAFFGGDSASLTISYKERFWGIDG